MLTEEMNVKRSVWEKHVPSDLSEICFRMLAFLEELIRKNVIVATWNCSEFI